MGALVGLGVGVGLLLVWSAFVLPRETTPARATRAGCAATLAAAGLGHVSSAELRRDVPRPGGSGRAPRPAGVRHPAGRALLRGAWPASLPVALVRSRARRRAREYADLWPEAVDNLACAVRAGLSLPEALSNLGDSRAGAAAPGLRRVRHRLPAVADGSASASTGSRNGSPTRSATASSKGCGSRARSAAASSGRLLRNLSGYLRDEARTRSEMESRQAWSDQRRPARGGRAVGGAAVHELPVRGHPSATTRPAASSSSSAAALACLVAYRLMMRIGRLPTERRILS